MPYLKREAPCPEPIDCKILTAALNLFVAKGYYNVSIHEIQETSDVSIGSIYRHFGSKAGVAKALYEHCLNEVDELIDGVTENIESPIEQIEETIKQFFAHSETHPEIISFIFHTKHTEFLTDEPLMCDAAPFVKIHKMVNQAKGNNDLTRTDATITTAVLLGSMIRIIQLQLDDLLEKPPIDYLESVLSSLWDGLKK